MAHIIRVARNGVVWLLRTPLQATNERPGSKPTLPGAKGQCRGSMNLDPFLMAHIKSGSQYDTWHLRFSQRPHSLEPSTPINKEY